ncbi:2967_t:CDS:1, partial [Ambispora leptoticha]
RRSLKDGNSASSHNTQTITSFSILVLALASGDIPYCNDRVGD